MVKSISACYKHFFALVIACMMAQPASALTFSMDTMSGATNDTVRVSVKVYDFADLVAIQGTIQFDPAVAAFIKVELPVPAVLPGLGVANFGTTQAATGKITFSWDDGTLLGVTLADGAIFSIKFKLVGTAGQQSLVTFANSPTALEFVDINFTTVPADALNNGLVQIQGGDPCAGITCDDSDACTTDTCIAGTCEFTPIVCDDADDCTDDFCAGTCQFTPINCDDTDLCTTDTCAGGVCLFIPVSCNDDDACTVDQCTGGACTNTPAFCDDGDACTTDGCDSITSCTITPVVCDDADACTTDGCDSLSGCTTTPVVCNDNDACTTDSCTSGSCINTTIPGCNDPCDTLICDDGVDCTLDFCDPVAGCLSQPDDQSCEDNLTCTSYTCDATNVNSDLRGCLLNLTSCDDGNPCTDDLCDPLAGGPGTGCVDTPNDLNICSDANACTDDACSGGNCVGTPNDLNVCSDGTDCTDDVCNGGACEGTPNNANCDDVDACNGLETCDLLLGCQSGTPLICNDGDLCTTDDCNPLTGCTVTAVVCDDGNTCTINACDALGCTYTDTCTQVGFRLEMEVVNGSPNTDVVMPVKAYGFIDLIAAQGTIQFDPSVVSFVAMESYGLPGLGAANFGTTQAANGKITFSWDDATLSGVSVPDATVIFAIRFHTGNAGQTATSFVSSPTLLEFTDVSFNTVTPALVDGLIQISGDPCVGVSCDDNDACTTDSCNSGNCINTPIVCDDGNICTTDGCDIISGCTATQIICDDGNQCTSDDCNPPAGCIATPIVCNDGDDCTTDGCDQLTGCITTPVICDDGDQCTTDTCLSGSCAFTAIPGCNDPCDTLICADSDLCTVDSCTNSNCFFPQINCDDNDLCTVDFCEVGIGSCINKLIDCSDNNSCTNDACDPQNGCSHTAIVCNDGDACTIDGCDIISACTITPITCDDGNTCTTDGCDVITGCTASPTVCDDGDACTTNECIQGSCIYTPITCNDFNSCTVDACAGGQCTFNDTCIAGFRLTMDMVSGAQGTDVVMPIRAYNFTDIIAIQGTVQFDPSVAAFVAMDSYGLPGLGAANFGTTQAANGKITFSWDDATLAGVSVPSATAIFSIKFNLVGNAGESSVTSFVNTPTLLEFTDVTFNTVTATLTDGLIQILGCVPACNDGDACTTDECISGTCEFTPIACDDGNQCTNDACILGSCVYTPVNCDDGDPCTVDLCSVGICTSNPLNCDDGDLCTSDTCLAGSCIHTPIPLCFNICDTLTCSDANLCTIDSCTNDICFFPQIDCNDGNDCTTDLCDLGNCFNNPITCDDVNDCTTDLCVGGACKYTPISCDDGDLCTTDDCAGGSCINTPITCNDNDSCTVDVCVNGQCVFTYTCPELFRLKMDTLSGAATSDIVMPVRSYGFKDIIAIQGTIQFDPAVASFVQVEPVFGLPGLGATNFGTTLASTGKLTFSWDDATLTGVTVPRGTVIFSIRFNLVGNNGESSVTSFVSTPTLLEFVDVNFNTVTATLNDGLIIISGGGPIITTSSITPSSFCSGDNVNVNFTKNGTFNPGNTFTAQLSDENGSFSNPVNIGSVSDTAAAPISATIPANTITGTNYRIRVVSSSPLVNGTNNGADLTINAIVAPGVSIAASNTTSCPGDNVTFTATPINGGANPTYDWLVNGISTGVNTDVFNSTALNDNDVVSLEMTGNAVCASSTTATSDSITMTISSTLTPKVTIVASAIDICSGETVTFTATPENGGATPVYNWLLNDVSTGVTSSVFSSSIMNTGDSVKVEMTSSLSCATPSSATSNSIRIFVNPSVNTSVSITASTTIICSGTSVMFTATPVNGGTTPSYQWKVNGLNEGTGSDTFSSSTLNDGDSVKVEMTSSEQCATPDTAVSNDIAISVTPSVAPTVSITASTTSVCIGENVLFTAIAINGGTTPSYQWMVNGTNTGIDSDTFSSATLADNDIVNVMLTSNSACANPATATSSDIRMTVASSLTPAVTITASSASICTGDNVTFNATAINGGATPTYDWLVNGVNAGTNSNTYNSTTLNDNDVVSLMLTSSLSCAIPDTALSNNITISIAAAVIPGVSITASSNSICAGTRVTFTAAPVNGGVTPSYQWKVNGTNAGTNSDTLISSSLNDNDAVSLVMISGSSCANPASATSNTILMNVNPVLNPAVSITTASTTVCVNDNVTFTATAINGGATPTYQWLLNGTAAGTNSNVFSSASINDGDVVALAMISSATCASSTPVSSNNITMSVVTSITPAVTISVNVNNVCLGSTVTFTAIPVNGGVTPTYQWKVDNVTSGPNSQVFLTSAINNGSQVSLEMTSGFSCAVPPSVTSNMITMTVGAPQTISFTGLDVKYCVDVAAQTMNGSPLNGNFSGPGVSGNTFVPYNAGPGTYQIGYSFIALSGCTAITSQTVTVNDLPAVNIFNLDNRYCSLQQSDTLVGSPFGGVFSGTGISGSVFSVPSVSANTTIPVTYSYTDSNSCKGVVTKVTTINPVTKPVLIGVKNIYCENQSVVSLNAAPAGGTFTGSGVTSIFFDPAAAGSGSHVLEYTYVDANNCANQVTETINVATPPQVSLGNVATEYCYNAAPLTLVGTPQGGVFTSDDQTGDNVVNGDFFSPNNGSPDSTYTIKYAYSDSNQCTNSATQDVSILNPPFVEFEMDEDSVYCSYLNSVFLDVTIPGGIYYGPGVTGDRFNPSAVGPGDYFIAYYLTNQSGCTGSNKILLTVDECTGIPETGEDIAILVYPNPSEGNFVIEILADNSSDVKLEVFSIEGKLLMEKEISNYGNGTKEQLDLSGYAEGMYLLKMNFGDKMMMKRVVVTR